MPKTATIIYDATGTPVTIGVFNTDLIPGGVISCKLAAIDHSTEEITQQFDVGLEIH